MMGSRGLPALGKTRWARERIAGGYRSTGLAKAAQDEQTPNGPGRPVRRQSGEVHHILQVTSP